MNIKLYEGERIDDLQRDGLRIIQHCKKFCFGTDAILLASFASVRRHDRVIELGTGTGVISLLLASESPNSSFIGIELLEYMADMAKRSVILNDMQDRIKILNQDLKLAHESLGFGCCDLVISNPPYGAKGATIKNPNDNRAISRHEVMCTLDDVIAASYKLLKNSGRLCLIYPAVRIAEVIISLKNHKIEPKKLKMVHHKSDKKPILLLVEGAKGAKPGLIWDTPLYMHMENGKYTQEMKQIYHVKD